MLVRGPNLAASMSSYLIERIAATPNIQLRPHTEVVELHGDPLDGLAGVTWRDRQTGATRQEPIRNAFLFVGADPETDWAASCGLALDAHGFVLTGPAATRDRHAPAGLEGSIPGVFAVGDVRSGSVKRVGGAIGEGAAVVPMIHHFLAALPAAA
jgi:thioredoxin reductase (NADPH)